MLGDSSREEKLAAARKKLKQYQKKKEAEKVKSSSRQSTPDSQVDLTSNGNEPHQMLDADDANFSKSIVDNIYTETSLPNLTTEPEANMELNHKVTTNPHQLESPLVGSFCENESNSVNGTAYDMSEICENIVATETPSTSQNLINGHSSIQRYFTTECNKSGNQNLFENVGSTLKESNSDTHLNQETKDMNEHQRSSFDLTEPLVETSLSNIPMEETTAPKTKGSELEVHTQTISILVAEKSEQQSRLQQLKDDIEKRDAELSDLLNKLQSSQNEVNILRESNSFLNNELESVSESVDKSNTDQDFITLELDKYKATCDDLKSMNAELNTRLLNEFEEKSEISQELTNTKSKLELANIHIQQLRDSSNEDLAIEIRTLKEVNEESQKKITYLESSLSQADSNRASIEQEYKSYGNHLVAQLEVAYQKITQNEVALQKVTQTKDELESKLNSLKTYRSNEGGQVSSKKLDELNKLCQDLSTENNSMKQNLSALEMDNKSLSKLCVEQRESLEKMEVAVDRRDSNEVDTTQLLQAMQSDKVAAARALSQNKQLKEQLEELQNGFIMMSNKKLELTEKLEIELHFKKGLQSELSQLKEQISIYNQLTEQKNKTVEIVTTDEEKPLLSSEVTEADSNDSVPSKSLMDIPAQHISPPAKIEFIDGIIEDAHKCVDEAAVAAIKESEGVIATEKPVVTIADSDNFIKKETFLTLENRFTKCMRDLAASEDEKHCLDHLVQRLQHETEAVGDYITIYQFQRGVMKKEVEELKSELTMLKNERDVMRPKLAYLQNLVSRLPGETVLLEKPYPELHNETSPENCEEGNLTTIEEMSDITEDEPKNKKQTVTKIMKLISEMESTSQMDVSGLNMFHPCLFCSGQLINV